MSALKVVGITIGIIIVGCIVFFSVKEYGNSKEEPNYVLNYIKEHRDDKTASLIVKRNGETLTSINENEKLPLASMSKIIIAIEYAKQVAEGKIRKGEQISLKELERYYVKNTDGGAHPAWLADVKAKELVKSGQTSLEEVVKGMIHYSSNANAKDYMSLMEKINNRNYFTQQIQDEIENIFKGTVGEGIFEFAGQKGGSTAFVLTNSFYGTDKNGNKIEIVFMMNNLSEKSFEKLLSNMDYFIRDIVISEEFRNKL
ncbi:hypothetical protein CN907_15445 [Bacillus anthracis]|nr:hypothetical protein CN907_15445 [Bacillus anthracis]